jgi:AmmeMemoRadiSam system protein A
MADLDLNKSQEKEILKWIHQYIGTSYGHSEPPPPEFIQTMPGCGVFVTLHLKGELRGCIGYIQSDRELLETLKDAAFSAAFKDYRFTPLLEEEWNDTKVEISLLSPMEKVSGPEDLIMGKHGALMEATRGRGLFLPQVAAEQNWDTETFMNHLCLKSGLFPEFWREGQYSLFRFTARIYSQT